MRRDLGAKSADTLLCLPYHRQRVARPPRMDEYKLTVCQSCCVQQHRLFFWTDLPPSEPVHRLETIFNLYSIGLRSHLLVAVLLKPTVDLTYLKSSGKRWKRWHQQDSSIYHFFLYFIRFNPPLTHCCLSQTIYDQHITVTQQEMGDRRRMTGARQQRGLLVLRTHKY